LLFLFGEGELFLRGVSPLSASYSPGIGLYLVYIESNAPERRITPSSTGYSLTGIAGLKKRVRKGLRPFNKISSLAPFKGKGIKGEGLAAPSELNNIVSTGSSATERGRSPLSSIHPSPANENQGWLP
jgi:hypothetical protein